MNWSMSKARYFVRLLRDDGRCICSYPFHDYEQALNFFEGFCRARLELCEDIGYRVRMLAIKSPFTAPVYFIAV